jgi:hypothetical protein
MRTLQPIRRLTINVVYFGVPVLVALSSAIFPVSNFLRQAMVGFVIVWCLAGSWLLTQHSI